MTRAIAETAIKSGDLDTTNAFVDANLNLADAAQRLWNAEHRKMTEQDITTTWRVAALKPSALSALQPYEIQAAATGQTGVGTWNVR
jgi:D-alanyl-D-alanine dipeptidase